jgi:hypothetical protein
MNSRTDRQLNELKGKGWDASIISDDAIVDENMAQLFTYWPHNHFVSMSTFSMDRYVQFIEHTEKDVPAHSNNAELFAHGVLELGLSLQKKKTKKVEEDLAMIVAMYCSKSKAYAKYSETMFGMPFAFFAVMYPKNKKYTAFAVKPAMLAPLTETLTPSQAIKYGQQIMESDMTAGKKEYFKYLPKRK